MSAKQVSDKRLVIVESPTKAKTIRRFLPSSYQVEASMGHVRDLPASAAEIPKEVKGQSWARLGVNPDENFEPLYIVPSKKKKVVNQLKSALKDASELYIATDEDREGESIGWHLLEVLDPKVPVKRMVFHEITEDAILGALEATRDINHHLVDAQETRRILDRLVGYSISPLLWKKIAPKLSAGRVQSVAVRLMVLREKERLAFVPAGYWDLKALLEPNAQPDARAFESVLTKVGGIRVATGKDFAEDTGKLKPKLVAGENVVLLSQQDAFDLATSLEQASWQVAKVETRNAKRNPAAPFTTSTLQQEASRKLGMSAKETMRTAQGLYENGYITYMRTDSTHLSSEAISASRAAVERRYGTEYLSERPRQYKTKSRNAQEAHEAIRPAGTAMQTADEHKLTGVEARVYDLIWKRTVATQMAEARLKLVTVHIDASSTNTAGEAITATFRASGRTTEFPGFFRAYVEGSDDPDAALDEREQPLPDLTEGDTLTCNDLAKVEHETKPPARFTEASLVKLLEQEGIGRPSTYASIIDTVIRRGYVRKQSSQLVPTFTAFATNNLLEQQFNQLVDTGFTAGMEQVLDDIATGELAAKPYLESFYKGKQTGSDDAEGLVERVEDGLESVDARAVSTLEFPKWGKYLIRVGRYGPYVEGEIEGETVTTSVPPELAPADIDEAKLEELLTAGNAGDVSFGEHPDTGREMLLKSGPYGPYLEMESDEKKPKRTSLPKGVNPAEVTIEMAISLLNLPRVVGQHPDTGKNITVQIGRFGPYARHASTSASLGKDDDLLTVGFERVLEIIQKKEVKNKPLRIVGEHPESGETIDIREGRYGPYVKYRKVNVSLPKDAVVDEVSIEDALALIATKADTKAGRASKGGAKKAKAKKKTTKTKRKKAAKPAGPKATPRDLEPFLTELDDDVRQVVIRLEGMEGHDAQDVASAADSLGLKEEDVQAAHKRGMFKLRMAYGKARKSQDKTSAQAA
ncbi:MAG: type I DNA topoisomerase [Deinococcota bacterium]